MSSRQKRKSVRLAYIPEAPSAIKDGHVQEAKGTVRGRYRQTKDDPLRGYADAGQINEDQYMAGDWYAEKLKAMQPSGRDSTNVDRVTGAGSGFPINDTMADATKKVISVDSHLPQTDRQILRSILGDGFTATEAVREATGEDGRHYPVPRLREALQSLVRAISAARASKWRFLLTTVNSSANT
jgi:hypothetical protein